MTSEQMTSLAISAGILFAAYKFGGKFGSAFALSVGSLMVAKRVPYLSANI